MCLARFVTYVYVCVYVIYDYKTIGCLHIQFKVSAWDVNKVILIVDSYCYFKSSVTSFITCCALYNEYSVSNTLWFDRHVQNVLARCSMDLNGEKLIIFRK